MIFCSVWLIHRLRKWVTDNLLWWVPNWLHFFQDITVNWFLGAGNKCIIFPNSGCCPRCSYFYGSLIAYHFWNSKGFRMPVYFTPFFICTRIDVYFWKSFKCQSPLLSWYSFLSSYTTVGRAEHRKIQMYDCLLAKKELAKIIFPFR